MPSLRLPRRRCPTTRAAVGLLALVLVGCAPYAEHLRHMNDEGRHAEAAEDGSRWLERHASERETDEWRAVRYERARAGFGAARDADTADAYRAFRADFGDVPGLDELLAEARERQAAAEYRDDVAPSHDVARFRTFRREYSGTAAAERALRVEAELALSHASEADTVGDFAAFRLMYGEFTELAPLVERASAKEAELALATHLTHPNVDAMRRFRETYSEIPAAAASVARAARLEAEMALTTALAANTVDALDRYVHDYSGLPEATSSVVRARMRIVELSFDAAVRSGDIETLTRFRDAHPEEPWPERASQAIGERIVSSFTASVTSGATLSSSAVDRLESFSLAHASELRSARPDETLAESAARRSNTSELWRAMSIVYSDSDRRTHYLERLHESLWLEFSSGRREETGHLFARYFPEDPRVADVDRILRETRERERLANRGYSVAVQRSWTSRQTEELTFTVDDCAGRSVIGLTPSNVRVRRGGEGITALTFRGMEDERPLGVEIALDLSGSMDTEQDAVRRSIGRFVETLRQRGRDARLGLIGYADTIPGDRGPTSSPREFTEWLARLPTTRGGTAEDGVGALARAATVLSRAEQERVVVLLSDEQLQLNVAGGRELRIEAGCMDVLETTACTERCTDTTCVVGCLSRLGPRVSRALATCRSRGNLGFCAANVLRTVGTRMPACSSAAPVVTSLIDRLARVAVRPFFVVSDSGSASRPFEAYEAIADRLGGEVRVVPNDSRQPAPYEAALLSIAELLSRQYVMNVPVAAHGADAVELIVRPSHEWEALPAPDELEDVASSGGSAGCPSLVGVRADGAVVRSSDCGRRFEDLGVRAAAPRFSAVAGSVAAIPLVDGRVAIFADERVRYVAHPGVTTYRAPTFDASRRLWSIVDVDAGAHVVAFEPDGTTAFDWPLPSDAHVFSALPTSTGTTVCVLGTGGVRRCRALEENAWRRESARHPGDVAAASSVVVDVGYPLTLLALADGRVLRSVDRGATFTEVASPIGRPRTLAVSARRDLICAGSAGVVYCSEDDGAEWFPVGSPTERSLGASPYFHGSALRAVRDHRVHAAYRVLTRELPAASALFETASDGVRQEADTLLHALAEQLRSEPDAIVRIEGHADSRGDTAENEALAERRATSVARRLADFGIASSRMRVRSFGERRPIRTGNSAADHARNRRVEIVVLDPVPDDGWYASGCE